MAIKLEGSTPLLQVFDMPRSVAFYQDAFGFKVTQQSQSGHRFDWCLLKLGEIKLMLNTAYEEQDRPESPDPARVAAHDDTGWFFSCQDLDAASAHLRALGIEAGAQGSALRHDAAMAQGSRRLRHLPTVASDLTIHSRPEPLRGSA